MALFRRRPEVTTHVVVGFHAAEAPALQRSILQAMGRGEHPSPVVVPAQLQVDRGADRRLVLVWHNVVVGFVPADAAAPLAGALDEAEDAVLLVRGAAYRDGRTWRIWVGDVPVAGFPRPPDGLDVLAPPDTTVLGVPLRRDGRP